MKNFLMNDFILFNYNFFYRIKIIYFLFNKNKWGFGIGDWGMGPIPNPHYIINFSKFNLYLNKKN
jgi:hypothetical protein